MRGASISSVLRAGRGCNLETLMSSASQDFQAPEIRAQLARILASRAFARANRSCQLLSYLVDCAMDGRLEQLKEYPIAVEVFGRDKSFDPRIDSLVRVEFTRLRNRLAAYYETSTEEDEILIALSPGSYLPLFERRIPRSEPDPSGVPPRPARTVRQAYWFAILGG